MQGQKLFLWRSTVEKEGISHCSQQCFSLYPESQCVWERSEAKKASQISLCSGCKILERCFPDPPLARQDFWGGHTCIMVVLFIFLRELLQNWMRTAYYFASPHIPYQFRDCPSVFAEVFRGHTAELLWNWHLLCMVGLSFVARGYFPLCSRTDNAGQ